MAIWTNYDLREAWRLSIELNTRRLKAMDTKTNKHIGSALHLCQFCGDCPLEEEGYCEACKNLPWLCPGCEVNQVKEGVFCLECKVLESLRENGNTN